MFLLSLDCFMIYRAPEWLWGRYWFLLSLDCFGVFAAGFAGGFARGFRFYYPLIASEQVDAQPARLLCQDVVSTIP